MLSYNESLKILKETNALQEGHFILSSGLHSNKYIQCAKLLSNPDKAEIICKSLSEKIINEFKKVDLILSPAIGGIVVGYEIGRQLKKKTIFAERTDGEMIIRRGFEILPNLNVVIVEDVITTGKSALECSKLININKANLLGYACIIDRSDEKLLIKDKIISQIKFSITTYREKEIPDNLKKIAPQKPGSRNFVK
jgi:orotate phosphoribosyltransferase